MVGVEIGAHGGMDARGAAAALAEVLVLAAHHIHIGGGTAEVAEGAAEVGHLGYLAHLAQDALLGAAHDVLALMSGDGAEGAPAEASAVDGDGVAYHLVGGDALAAILGMGEACVGQVVGAVGLLGGHRGEGRLDNNIFTI